jgi:hypothetical protein
LGGRFASTETWLKKSQRATGHKAALSPNPRASLLIHQRENFRLRLAERESCWSLRLAIPMFFIG